MKLKDWIIRGLINALGISSGDLIREAYIDMILDRREP